MDDVFLGTCLLNSGTEVECVNHPSRRVAHTLSAVQPQPPCNFGGLCSYGASRCPGALIPFPAIALPPSPTTANLLCVPAGLWAPNISYKCNLTTRGLCVWLLLVPCFQGSPTLWPESCLIGLYWTEFLKKSRQTLYCPKHVSG